VEFFNPKMRGELEKKDAEIIKKTGQKGAAPGGDQWVWLTSYSRIPVGFQFLIKKTTTKFILYKKLNGNFVKLIQNQRKK
jgi:hypothetical protein